MSTYLVECYWPGVDELRLGEVVERLMVASPGQRGDVGWVSSVLIPEDEIVLCLATGPSAEAIRATAQRAGLPAERVVPCVQVRPLGNGRTMSSRL
jgi:Protein of unknown function (DUF4242)